MLSTLAPASAKHHAAVDKPRHDAPAHPDTYDAWIANQAKAHGIPEALVHRVVMRESRYRPDAMHKRFFGLMQITYATARSMGYQGEPKGLLDAKTNLTYGVPYLANAYLCANNNPDRAVALYSSGYYFEAKRQHKLGLLRTAASEPVIAETQVAETVVPPAPEPQVNPVSQLFQALAGASVAPPALVKQIADASTEMEPVEVDVPLPPRRPKL